MTPRQLLGRYVPAHFQDPAGLAMRLVKSRDGAAWFALGAAGLGVAAAPLDMLLAHFEPDRRGELPRPRHPLVIVCGPPRSGTTVVYQTLAAHLPVSYFSNLTSLFPRSPLTAMRLFGKPRQAHPEYHSYYGKTRGLAGTNDALYLWDRWLGADRDRPPKLLLDGQRAQMQRFFAACDAFFGRPLINKNNNLIASAHLVAEALPHARFVCLERDRSRLVRSLYRARCDIHGQATAAYGLTSDDDPATDPVESVCRQVEHLARLTDEQEQRLGAERFRRVRYEDFCRDPALIVGAVARDMFGDSWQTVGSPPASFPIPREREIDPAVAAAIDARLANN